MNDLNRTTTRNFENTDITGGEGGPVATGVGAVLGGAAGGIAGGAAAGAAVGGMTGPVGIAVGATIGAVAGALAGNGMGSAADPVAEDAYWRDNHFNRPYASGSNYDEYRPAYGYGVDAFTRYPDRTFDDVEPELQSGWNKKRGNSSLDWDSAKHATRDAWQRVSDTVERAIPGDSDRAGKQDGNRGEVAPVWQAAHRESLPPRVRELPPSWGRQSACCQVTRKPCRARYIRGFFGVSEIGLPSTSRSVLGMIAAEPAPSAASMLSSTMSRKSST